MQKTSASYIVFLLMACSQPSKPCLHYLECSEGPADCQAEAREECPGGYKIVNEAGLGEAFAGFARTHFPGASTGVPHMVVTCDP